MAEKTDILVIGAGIAGASAAAELAAHGRVLLLEQEPQPAYHTTGRSAALFTETYGNLPIRRLTSASRAFYEAPPDGFADASLLTPRGTLFIAREDQLAALDALTPEDPAAGVHRVDGAEAERLNPLLRPGYVAAALHEPGAEDIDVHGLHGGYLRLLRARGGELRTRAEVTALTREPGHWRAETRDGPILAPIVVNAAGAWAEAVAALAGLPPLGLVPKRRTAFLLDPPEGIDPAGIPATIDAEETFYLKPDAGKLIGSPADETPSPPCDAQPEELDIAIGVDRIERASTLKVRRIAHKWAGLRSFFPDKTPTVGFDPLAKGFFWLAGQGGYGIQTAPAMARTAAALATGGPLPEDLVARGLRAEHLAPDRLRCNAPAKP